MMIINSSNFNGLFDVKEVHNTKVDFIYIFKNNFFNMLGGMLGGLISFSIVSFNIYIVNIFSLGIIVNNLLYNNMIAEIVKLIPHGLFELFALSFMLIFCFNFFITLFKYTKDVICSYITIVEGFLNLLLMTIANIFFLMQILFVAAIVECFVSIL